MIKSPSTFSNDGWVKPIPFYAKIKKITKIVDFPDFQKISYFGAFLSRSLRSGHIFDAFKFNDIAGATFYLLFNTNIKATPVLVL